MKLQGSTLAEGEELGVPPVIRLAIFNSAMRRNFHRTETEGDMVVGICFCLLMLALGIYIACDTAKTWPTFFIDKPRARDMLHSYESAGIATAIMGFGVMLALALAFGLEDPLSSLVVYQLTMSLLLAACVTALIIRLHRRKF